MALIDANPAFGPAEQGIMIEMSEIDRFGAIWIDSDTFEKIEFRSWQTRALELKNLAWGAPGTENQNFFKFQKCSRNVAELRSFRFFNCSGSIFEKKC